MLTVDDYGAIRRARRDGKSIRRIALDFGHSRNTIRYVLKHPEPGSQTRNRNAPVLGPFQAVIDQILADDEDAPPKQRHTAAQVCRRLRDEHGYHGCYGQVQRYLRKHHRPHRETFIPLGHLPGQRLEADFGHIYVDFPDGRRQVPFLVAAWAYSNAPFVIALPCERTEAILHGMVAAFEFFGAVAKEVGGFRVALDMAFGALSKYDFCFVGMGFPEVGSLGMEANGVGSKRILESADQAKSPRRILVRSLLKSRNKLREKYRELRAECKRWRNQAAAVERSRSTWRERALAHEASAQEDRAARAKLESQLQQLREQSERREVESAELRDDWPPWKGRKKKG